MKKDIISEIKKSNLQGRGGAAFLTYKKWEAVKKAKSKNKFVICNASEGEPDVHKDYFVIKNYAQDLIDGMMLAIDCFAAKKGILYLNRHYYDEFSEILKKIIGINPIEVFKKSKEAGYIGGEETALLNDIEGLRAEPRLKPPYPSKSGLYLQPTLINNVETFYSVALISKNRYKQKRFFTIAGDVLNQGVFKFDEFSNIDEVLKKSNNYPEYDFFVQVGGGASGEVLSSDQLQQPVSGSASITVYSSIKHNPRDLLKKWINFYFRESCGQCTTCREGTYRLKEILSRRKPDWGLFNELIDNLEVSSFCALGYSVPVPVKTYLKNILKKNNYNSI